MFRFSPKILLISGFVDKAVVGKDGNEDIKPLFELKDNFFFSVKCRSQNYKLIHNLELIMRIKVMLSFESIVIKAKYSVAH